MDQRGNLKRNFKKYLNQIKTKTHQNVQDMAMAALRGKFIELNAYVGKEENLKPII